MEYDRYVVSRVIEGEAGDFGPPNHPLACHCVSPHMVLPPSRDEEDKGGHKAVKQGQRPVLPRRLPSARWSKQRLCRKCFLAGLWRIK